MRYIKIKLWLLLSFFLFTCILSAKEFSTLYYIQLTTDGVKDLQQGLWDTLQGKLVYEINNINYYKLTSEKTLSPLQISFSFPNFRNNTNFILKAAIIQEKRTTLEYTVSSHQDFEALPEKFIRDLKITLPVKGIIFFKKGLQIRANIGNYFHIKRGDIFFITDNKTLKGTALVDRTENHYSECIITSCNSQVNTNDILIPFTYDLNNNYNLRDTTIDYKNIKDKTQIKGLYGSYFNVMSSPGNFFILADEKETGLYQNKTGAYEQLEKLNFNYIKKIKFMLNEKFLGYIADKTALKVFDLQNYRKNIIKINPSLPAYYIIEQKDETIYPLTNVIASDYDFHHNDSMIFFDATQKKVIDLNLIKNMFQEIKLNTAVSNIQRLDITKNNKKLLLYSKDTGGSLLIHDLESKEEQIIPDVPQDYSFCKNNIEIYYRKGKNIIFLNLYHYNQRSYTLNHNFEHYTLTSSERYVFFYNSINNNQLNYFDLETGQTYLDVYEPVKYKFIIKVEPLDNDSLLLFGKLSDQDGNNKLDYRDLNSAVWFNFISGRQQLLNRGIDDVLGLSNYNRYFIFRSNRDLYIQRIPDEKAINKK